MEVETIIQVNKIEFSLPKTKLTKKRKPLEVLGYQKQNQLEKKNTESIQGKVVHFALTVQCNNDNVE